MRPGQFGKVRFVPDTVNNALVVPQEAVNELQGSFQVAVVDQNNKVSIRPVKMGETHRRHVGSDRRIETGRQSRRSRHTKSARRQHGDGERVDATGRIRSASEQIGQHRKNP